jgi:hypothetical protein
MKITLGRLRKIIRETVRQQTAKPGGIAPGWGGKFDDEEEERLAHGGMRGVDELEEDDREDTNQ